MRTLAAAALIVVVHSASADAPAMHRTVEAMRAADDSVCNLLRAQAGDRCSELATGDKRATVYRSGTERGINRIVVALPVDGQTLIGPSIDVMGYDDATGAHLTSVASTVRDISLDGKPALAVEVTTTFGKAFATHDAIACAANGRSAWHCSHVAAGRCAITVGDTGQVTSTCGDASLSLR